MQSLNNKLALKSFIFNYRKSLKINSQIAFAAKNLFSNNFGIIILVFLTNFQSEIGRKKGDFVFQTGHVIEIVTKLFLVIQNATAKPPEVHISTE